MSVGERVKVKDRDGVHVCTVRYAGLIAGKEGTWVGVEWDDAGRGKNDGSVAGKRYFECRRAPKGGSFIKSEKIKRGISLVDAVKDRYTLGDSDLKDMSIQTSKRRTMAVDFSGMDKMSAHLKALNTIQTMTMHGSDIARGVRKLLSLRALNMQHTTVLHGALDILA